jgi:predicted protein tyrosine phosphatase
MNNRMWNIKNPHQGDRKKVLCVCSAGLLRSPTAAIVLSQEPFNFNTRAAGLEKNFALIPVDEVLIAWADEVWVMDRHMEDVVKYYTDKPIINLDIPDNFSFMDDKLVSLIKEKALQQCT